MFRFQFSNYHQTQPSKWDFDFGLSKEFDTYPFRTYLSGYDNALEVILFQKSSDLDYLCVKDKQGFSVSTF